MDAELPNVEIPTAPRFFCHRCNVDFEDASQDNDPKRNEVKKCSSNYARLIEHIEKQKDYKCPYCDSGFIEQLQHQSSVNNFDPTMNNFEDTDDQSGHPMMHDLAFLMSGGRVRPGVGPVDSFIEHLVLSMGNENTPPGTVTAGTPFVLVGAPGDYVIGGDGLDSVVSQLLGQLEHSGPPPLTRDLIASIPTEDVKEEHMANGNTCSVCWDAYNLGEKISRLECGHIFHKTCIDPWLNLHATCPICRRNLLPPGTHTRPEDDHGFTTAFVNIRAERPNPMTNPTNPNNPANTNNPNNPENPNNASHPGENTSAPNRPDRPTVNAHRIRIPNFDMRGYNPVSWAEAIGQIASAHQHAGNPTGGPAPPLNPNAPPFVPNAQSSNQASINFPIGSILFAPQGQIPHACGGQSQNPGTTAPPVLGVPRFHTPPGVNVQSTTTQSTPLAQILFATGLIPMAQNPIVIAHNHGTGHNPTAAGHNPPGAGHNLPGTGHNPPGTGHNPPGTGHNPPGTGHNPPGMGNNPPGTGQPLFGNVQSLFGTGHSLFGIGQSLFGTGQNPLGTGQNPSGMGQYNPGMGQNNPGMGQNNLGLGQNTGMGQSCPVMGQNNPGMGHNTPGMGQNTPRLGQNNPGMGQNTPGMGQNNLGMGQNTPGMGQNSPGMGQNCPGVGQSNPGMGQYNPGIGQNNPGMGQNNPAPGQHIFGVFPGAGQNAAGPNPGINSGVAPGPMPRRLLGRVSVTPVYYVGRPAGPAPPPPQYNTDIDYD